MRLRGKIEPYTFTHSLENSLSSPMARGNVFVRPPNHLNPMMSDVAKLIPFRDAVRGEDLDWAIRLAKSGFLTNEYKSDDSRIHYIYNVRGTVHPDTLELQSRTSYETMLSMIWTTTGSAERPVRTAVEQPTLRLTPRGFVSR